MVKRIWKKPLGTIFSPLFVIITLLVSLLILLGFVYTLALEFGERLTRYSTSTTDQQNWTVSQLEADFLRLLLAAGAHVSNTQTLSVTTPESYGTLAQKFDLFYSRSNVFVVTVKQHLKDEDYVQRAISLQRDLQSWTKVFDATPPDAFPEWQSFLVNLKQEEEAIRSLVVDGLQIINAGEEAQRLTNLDTWKTYSDSLKLIMGLILLATIMTIYLIWSLYKRTHRAETAIDNLERTSRELERLSITDPLTGLMTRRALEKVSQLYKNRDALILWLDIDDFKSVNDAWGHGVGDELLQQISCTLRNCLGDDAHLFRLGGEEFGIVAPWYGENHAKDWSQIVCLEISKTSVYIDGKRISRTVSIGVSRRIRTQKIQLALEAADRAMFEAKRCGKNQVKFATNDF